MDQSLKILISGMLNLSSTEKTIDEQLKSLSSKLDSLKINIELDEKTMSVFNRMSDNIEKITQSLTGQKSAMQDVTRETDKETQAINRQISASEKLKLLKEKLIKSGSGELRQQISTTGDKFNQTTEFMNVNKDGTIETTRIEEVFDKKKLDEARKNLDSFVNDVVPRVSKVSETIGVSNEEIQKVISGLENLSATSSQTDFSNINNQVKSLENNTKKMLDEAYNTNEKFNKDAETLDKAHFMALRDNKAKLEAMDKIHYTALKQNRELDIKNQQLAAKEAETIDRAHYNALKDDRSKKEALEKQHSLALQQNTKRDYDFEQKKISTQLKLDSMKKTYTADPNALKSLSELETQLNSISKINQKPQFDKLNNEIKRVGVESAISGKHVLGLREAFRTAMVKSVVWAGAMTSIYFPLRQFQKGIQLVYELDTAMTELRKVTDASAETYRKFELDANKMAQSLGKLTVEVVNSASEWAKLGYTIKESMVLSRESLLYSMVGDIDARDASKSLISTVKGFGIQIDAEGQNVRKVVDLFNEIGNNYAISSEGIGEALRRSAASLSAAGNSIEQSVALVTAANAVLQDPTQVGTALKTVSMRIRGISDEGEDLSDLVPKLEGAFNKLGLTLKKNDDTFKSTYEIFDDLSKIWDKLSDFDQANITELVAGKRQGNIIAGMLKSWDDATNSLKSGLNSAGSAAKEHEQIMNSIGGKLTQFENSVVGFWQTSMNTQGIKDFIDSGTKLINVLTAITDKFGLLPPVIFLVTSAMFMFNKSFQTFALSVLPNLLGGSGAIYRYFTALSANIRYVGLSATWSIGALRGLRIALTSLVASTGVGLAFVALGYAIEKLSGGFFNLNKDVNTFDSSLEKNQKELNQLGSRYTELKSVVNDNTKSSEELTEAKNQLADVIQKISDLMPNLVTQWDAEGKAIDVNIEKLDEWKKKYSDVMLFTAKQDKGKYEQDKKNLQDKLKELNIMFTNLSSSDLSLFDKATGKTITDYRYVFGLEIKKLAEQINDLEQKIKDADDTIALFGEGIKEASDKINSSNEFIFNYKANTEKLSDAFDKSAKKLKTLNQAISDVEKSQSLSAETIADLILQYPQLASSVEKTADGYRINVDALNAVRDAQLETEIVSLKSASSITESAQTNLQERLKIYTDEVTAIESLSDAKIEAAKIEATLQEKVKQGFLDNKPEDGFIGPYLPKPEDLEIIKELEKLKKDTLEFGKSKDVLRELEEQLRNRQLGVSSSKSSPNLKDALTEQELTKELINSFNAEYAAREQLIKQQEKQIKLSEKQKDYNNAIQQTIELITNQRGAIDDLTTAQKKMADEEDNLRNKNSQYDTESWFTFSGDASLEYKQFLDSFRINSEIVLADTTKLIDARNEERDAIEKEQKAVEKLFNNLQQLKKGWLDNKNQIENMTIAIDASVESINGYADSMQKMAEDISKSTIDIIKKAYQEIMNAEKKQHDERIKQLDEQMKKYKEVVDDMIKQIDRASAAEDYSEDLSKKQKEAQDIQSQIDKLVMDDTIEAKAKREDLEKQHADKLDEIAKMQKNHTKELQKQALQDAVDMKQKEVDKEKEKMEKELKINQDKWQELLNDDRRFLEMQEDIVKGNLDKISEHMKELKLKVVGFADEMGEALSRNLSMDIQKNIDLSDKLKNSTNPPSVEPNSPNPYAPDPVVVGRAAGQFYDPRGNADEELTIKTMKKNSELWHEHPNMRSSYENANQQYGAEIGAEYRNGTWYKNGLPLYHEGGIVGGKGSSLIERLHKMFNLGQGEQLSILKQGELVLKDNPIANLMSNFKMPNLNAIQPRMTSAGGGSQSLSFEKLIHIDKIEKNADIDHLMNQLDNKMKSWGFVMR